MRQYPLSDTNTKWLMLFRVMILHRKKHVRTVRGQNTELLFAWDIPL